MPDNNFVSSAGVNRRQFTKMSVAAAASAAMAALPNAHVKFSTADGRPIRGAHSRADGRVPVAGLVDVSAGSKVLMTAFDGDKADAQLLKTQPLS